MGDFLEAEGGRQGIVGGDRRRALIPAVLRGFKKKAQSLGLDALVDALTSFPSPWAKAAAAEITAMLVRRMMALW